MTETWRDLLRARSWQALPPRIYTALVRQLFGTPPALNVVEALLVAAIGCLAAWRSSDPWLAALTFVTCVAILAIIPARRHFEAYAFAPDDAAAARHIERQFEYLSWTISACIGAMAARAILASGDMLVHLMLVSLALGATSSNIRYHFRPRIAFGKTIAINGPLVVAALASGNPYYAVLGLAAAAAAKLFLDIAMQLNGGAVALLTALEEKGRLAAKLTATNVDLQRRERERGTAEAALRRLQSEVDDAARMSAMGAMASTLAHELNQPLTAVTNYIRGSRRLLEKASASGLGDVAEALAAAEAGTLRAGQIIRRLRALVYRGAAETRPEDLDVLIREAAALALSDIYPPDIACRLELDPAARWAHVDQVQIQQVLINLIRNAVEAMEGARLREIVVATRLLAEDLIQISVADTGPGIGDVADSTLFAPFHSTKVEGLGIGLAISRTIVEAHGGRIWAADDPAGGAVFRMTLSRAPAPESDADTRIRAASE